MLDTNSFETILKKCKSINEISITGTQQNQNVLELIIKYCNHLKKISFDFEGFRFYISEDTIKQFGLKFGPNLRSIHFMTEDLIPAENYRLLLRSCPHLEDLFNVRLNGMFEDNKLLVPKLTKIANILYMNDNLFIEKFFSGCRNTLKHFDNGFG